MSEYRRWFVPGRTFFITLVTYARRPILTTDDGRLFLRNAINSVRERHPFTLAAKVESGSRDFENILFVMKATLNKVPTISTGTHETTDSLNASPTGRGLRFTDLFG